MGHEFGSNDEFQVSLQSAQDNRASAEVSLAIHFCSDEDWEVTDSIIKDGSYCSWSEYETFIWNTICGFE